MIWLFSSISLNYSYIKLNRYSLTKLYLKQIFVRPETLPANPHGGLAAEGVPKAHLGQLVYSTDIYFRTLNLNEHIYIFMCCLL